MLVDIRKLDDLRRITIGEDGVRLGARVRWRDIEDDQRLRRSHPLLLAAIEHVAHYQIRNRGTVGGSLAHADPAAELPGIVVTCDAEINVVGAKGPRTIPAARFFTGALSTALADDEIIVEVKLPTWPTKRRWGFEELSPRRGDFALAGIAAFYDVDSAGKATNAHIGVIGACVKPHRIPQAEKALDGRAVDDAAIQSAARAAEEALDPPSDLHASAAYRRSLAATLLERALQKAATT
jgi:carbon-monoxide dehydrogenase medium subunit